MPIRRRQQCGARATNRHAPQATLLLRCSRKKGGARGGFFQSSSVRLGHHHQRSHQIGGSFPSPLLYGPSTLWYTNKVRGKQVGSFFKSRFGTVVWRALLLVQDVKNLFCVFYLSLKNTSWWFLVLIFFIFTIFC